MNENILFSCFRISNLAVVDEGDRTRSLTNMIPAFEYIMILSSLFTASLLLLKLKKVGKGWKPLAIALFFIAFRQISQSFLQAEIFFILSSILTLVIFLLVLFQYRKWNLFEKHLRVYFCIQAFLLITGILKIIMAVYDIKISLSTNSGWIVLLITSAFMLGRFSLETNRRLFYYSPFLVTAAILIFTSYSYLFNELFPVEAEPPFLIRQMETCMFLVINIIFSIAIIIIPIKPRILWNTQS